MCYCHQKRWLWWFFSRTPPHTHLLGNPSAYPFMYPSSALLTMITEKGYGVCDRGTLFHPLRGRVQGWVQGKAQGWVRWGLWYWKFLDISDGHKSLTSCYRLIYRNNIRCHKHGLKPVESNTSRIKNTMSQNEKLHKQHKKYMMD